jgi:hypothetical protein
MAWCWFALLAERPADAIAAARAVELGGRPAGFLAAWRLEQGRPTGGLGIDVRAVDPAGFVGRMPMPVGPGIQRYAGSPWPWDRFPSADGTPAAMGRTSIVISRTPSNMTSTPATNTPTSCAGSAAGPGAHR